MNELDSEVITGILEKRGLLVSDDENTADLLIFNTCSVRDLAERKVMGKIGLLSQSRKDNPIIGVMGCMANLKKETLFKKLPKLDFVLGPNDIHQLDDVLDEILDRSAAPIRATESFHTEPDYTLTKRADNLKAFVSVIRGCNNFCSYCIVPYARGREVSRLPEHVLEECQKLADKGYKEITLLGQNVNSYGKDQPSWNCYFPDLLSKINDISGIKRIRFMTSHPKDITKSLMEAIRDLNKVCEFVHFPIQSGSERILSKMNRKYTLEEYLEKVQMLREIVPNVSIGTDIIVGFPTETDQEFQETYDVLKELEYSMAFLFKYSPRKGTAATRWRDDIPKKVKEERLQKLIDLQNDIYAKQRQKLIGQTVEVLVDRMSSRDTNMAQGKTRDWKNVLFNGNADMIGSIQHVKVQDFNNQTLLGDLAD